MPPQKVARARKVAVQLKVEVPAKQVHGPSSGRA